MDNADYLKVYEAVIGSKVVSAYVYALAKCGAEKIFVHKDDAEGKLIYAVKKTGKEEFVRLAYEKASLYIPSGGICKKSPGFAVVNDVTETESYECVYDENSKLSVLMSLEKKIRYAKRVNIVFGKVCSGKTTYAKMLAEKIHAVYLNVDEIAMAVISADEIDVYTEHKYTIEKFMQSMAFRIIHAGSNVVIDGDYWTEHERNEIKKLFNNNNIDVIMHYVKVSDEMWLKTIKSRNDNENTRPDKIVTDSVIEFCKDNWQEPSIVDVIANRETQILGDYHLVGLAVW